MDLSKPTGLRDRAMLELLYATGSAGLRAVQASGIGDLDANLGVLRTTGKGNKQRLVPVGQAGDPGDRRISERSAAPRS